MDKKELRELNEKFKAVAAQNYDRMVDVATEKANGKIATFANGLEESIVRSKESVISDADSAKTSLSALAMSILETKNSIIILPLETDPFFCSQYTTGSELEKSVKLCDAYKRIHEIGARQDACVELAMTHKGLELTVDLNRGYAESPDAKFIADARAGLVFRKNMYPGATIW